MSLFNISGSGSDLSSRHIPDTDTLSNISNTSFSFQIPGTAAAGDNLLADEDENDFFRNARGADVSLALTHVSAFSPVHTSPAPSVAERKDPVSGFQAAPTSMPDSNADTPVGLAGDGLSKTQSSNQRPKLSLNTGRVIRTIPTSPMTSIPLPTHEQSVDNTVECTRPLLKLQPAEDQVSVQIPERNTRLVKKQKSGIKTEEQEVHRRRLLRANRKIIEGGIAKSRIATSKKTREVTSRAVSSSTLPSESNPQNALSLSEPPVITEDPGTEGLLADASNSIFTTTGIAGRLIQYGQTYTDTFRGETDSNRPLDKLRVGLNFLPESTNKSSSVVQKASQEPSVEDCNDGSKFPIADSLVHHRKKYTTTQRGQIEITTSIERATVDFDVAPVPKHEGVSSIPDIIQEEDDLEEDTSKPLTLSQLSPRKQRMQNVSNPPTPITTSVTDVCLRPRPATKRPVPIESTAEEPRLKRSKGDKPKPPKKPFVSKGKRNPKPRVPSGHSQAQSRKPSATLSGSGSSSSSKKQSSSVRDAAPKPAGIRKTKSRIVSGGKQAAVFNPTDWNDNVRLPDENDMRRSNSRLKLSGSGLQNSRIQDERKQDEKTIFPFSFKAMDSQGAPQATEPIPGDSDSRSTSRSKSNSQSGKHKFYHPAPDFKAIHAAFDASLAHRKENVHSTIPLPMRWETDSRMQERKKFDERVREKEREKEKEEEEQRRLREAEEERDLKELRKKMVVKAHEVPEWYNARPKTKRQEKDVET